MEINEPTGELICKESGSTTFEQCGWCTYAMGSHRYSYCIEGRCQILGLHSWNKEADIIWSDKCKIPEMSKSELSNLVEDYNRNIESLERQIKTSKNYIKILLGNFMSDAEDMPDLPDDRKYNHFNIGNEVAVYIEKNWYFGKVAPGYRHHDGCVSYILRSFGPQEREFWGNGIAIPTVMLKWEYNFFKNNPDKYVKWCKKAYNKDFNGKKLGVAPIWEI